MLEYNECFKSQSIIEQLYQFQLFLSANYVKVISVFFVCLHMSVKD